jgi:ribosomal protein S18 acetylase RimI-like enzyme
MSQGGVDIRQLNADDWRVFRDVRLAALQDSPECVGRHYAKERDGSEQQWRTFLQQASRFVAVVDNHPVGTASVAGSSFSGAADIVSVWVDPHFRRRGIGDALIVAVIEWAKHKDLRQALLYVNEGCDDAERLYQRHGFRRTGEAQRVDGDLAHGMALTF